jgi:hypothetical protein
MGKNGTCRADETLRVQRRIECDSETASVEPEHRSQHGSYFCTTLWAQEMCDLLPGVVY